MLIRTLDNVELIVPNAKFLSEPVTNLTRTESRIRIRISVGVSYDSDPEEVRQVLLSAADHENILRFPKPSVQFTGFGDNSINFDLLVWVDDPERSAAISSELRFKLWYALKEHHLEIPFPQRDIHIRSDFRVNRPPADQI
jgi:small-conductance mechanosensitive channel